MGGAAWEPEIRRIKSYDIVIRLPARGRYKGYSRLRRPRLRQDIPIKGKILRTHREAPTAKCDDLPPYVWHCHLRSTLTGPCKPSSKLCTTKGPYPLSNQLLGRPAEMEAVRLLPQNSIG